QEPRGGLVERAMRRLVAPRRQRAGRGQLLRRLDLAAADAARFGEADQEIDVLRAGLFLDDVLQQEVPCVLVRAVAVDRRAPARELRDVLVVLRGPEAELGPRQLAVHPLLRERVHPAVPGVDRGFELLPEWTRLSHGLSPLRVSVNSMTS